MCYKTCFIFQLLCVIEAKPTFNFDFSSKTVVNCNVAILGSGFSGSFAAYKLSPTYKDSLCVIEKFNRDGGRIWDITEYPSGPTFGMGALRVKSNQKAMMALAEELQIELQKGEVENELLKVRGQYFYQTTSKNIRNDLTSMCENAFKNLTCRFSNTNDYDSIPGLLLNLYKNIPSLTKKHIDMPTFILSTIGDEGLAFIRASAGYHSLYSSVSSKSTLEFMDKSRDSSHYYPKGGMSEFIKRMLAASFINGGQIYRNETVLQLSSDPFDISAPFYIETSNYIFKAKNVLSSIDPLNFRNISGNIADTITSSPEFQIFHPIEVAVVTTWWNYRWWEDSKFYKDLQLNKVVSTENCFNVMMIPSFPYGRDQNVTRAVYDDGSCVNTWKTFFNENNRDSLASEVVSSLQNVFHDVTVPMPRFIYGFVHKNGWYLQKPESKFTNQEILEWSSHPVLNKNISLIGTAYNFNDVGWCNGGLISTMAVLMKFYNFTFSCYDNALSSEEKCVKLFKSSPEHPVTRNSFTNILP